MYYSNEAGTNHILAGSTIMYYSNEAGTNHILAGGVHAAYPGSHLRPVLRVDIKALYELAWHTALSEPAKREDLTLPLGEAWLGEGVHHPWAHLAQIQIMTHREDIIGRVTSCDTVDL